MIHLNCKHISCEFRKIDNNVKGQNITLKELAVQYRQSAYLLKQREDEIKRQVKQSMLTIETDTELRLRLLRQERYELLKIAAYLDSYYDKEENIE